MSKQRRNGRTEIAGASGERESNGLNLTELNLSGEIQGSEENIAGLSLRNRISQRIGSAIKGRWWAVAIIAVLSLSAFGAGWRYLEQDADRQIGERNRATYLHPAEESTLSKINPLLAAPLPSATPQLSKEYIYAGSRMLAVEDANANPSMPADLAVWRPTGGNWYVMGANSTIAASASWGASGDAPEAGDYDGDGKTDFAVYRASNNTWYIIKSSDGSYIFQSFGASGDIPVPADYDGDHKTDIAVYRPTTQVWYIQRSSDAQLGVINYGTSGDKPVPADYDGDGKADAAVYRSSNSTFYIYRSSDLQNGQGQVSTTITTSIQPVPADYDGDGKADCAIRDGANWLILQSTTGTVQTVSWQQAGDKAVQNDYDGDGKVDIAVWRDSTGAWYIRQSSLIGQTNELRQDSWGQSGDVPVPSLWRR